LKELKRIAGALSFLTVAPVRVPKELEGSAAYYPLAGWLIGGVLFLAWTPMERLPVMVRAFVIVALWELLSRGLHVDALADTADAFIAGGSRERILGIMSDTRTGAFGVMAIALLLVGKFALLSSMEWGDGRSAVLCACVMGRFALSLFACAFPPAKEEGLGALIISSSGAKELVVAAVLAIVPAAFIFRLHLLYASAGLVVCLALCLYAWRKIGGLTGDVLGACLELTELAALFAFL